MICQARCADLRAHRRGGGFSGGGGSAVFASEQNMVLKTECFYGCSFSK